MFGFGLLRSSQSQYPYTSVMVSVEKPNKHFCLFSNFKYFIYEIMRTSSMFTKRWLRWLSNAMIIWNKILVRPFPFTVSMCVCVHRAQSAKSEQRSEHVWRLIQYGLDYGHICVLERLSWSRAFIQYSDSNWIKCIRLWRGNMVYFFVVRSILWELGINKLCWRFSSIETSYQKNIIGIFVVSYKFSRESFWRV